MKEMPLPPRNQTVQASVLSVGSLYATVQKVGVCEIFKIFVKEVSYAHLDHIYLINTVILRNIITLNLN